MRTSSKVTVAILAACAAALCGQNYVRQAYVAIVNSSVDSTPIGSSAPSTGNFTGISAGTGGITNAGGYTGTGPAGFTIGTGGIVNGGGYLGSAAVTAPSFIAGTSVSVGTGGITNAGGYTGTGSAGFTIGTGGINNGGGYVGSAAVDVVTKTDKVTGRGLKTLSPPPIKKTAESIGLPIHQIDTFTGWSPPKVNLVIAVSFGLLVPPRILSSCRYGGLNVHPSMLPSLQGAAPIQWTILKGLDTTGITIQNLHPTKFDGGDILYQKKLPVPEPTTVTYDDLVDYLAPIGGQMLVKAIDSRLYKTLYPISSSWEFEASLAPKITVADMEIKFREHDRYDSHRILRMNRAMPRLWAKVAANPQGKDMGEHVPRPQVRVVFGRKMKVAKMKLDPDIKQKIEAIKPGRPFSIVKDTETLNTSDAPLLINTINHRTLAIPTMTVAGQNPRPAAAAAAKAGFFEKKVNMGGYDLYMFEKPLGWYPRPQATE